MFWKRWVKEYLPTLQERQKWVNQRPNFRVGDVVLIVDDNTPRGIWPLGLIVEVHPASDGLLRSVKVKVRNTVLTRPVNKLCMLEATEEVST